LIEIYAGPTAIKTIQEEGFQPELFSSLLGASGGPKWFCLFGLDKYLFGEFFNSRHSDLNIVGSSAGAFRAACFAQQDPIAALDRFAKQYSETTYSKKAKPEEITEKAEQLLEDVVGAQGALEIINNPTFKAHFIVAKSNGLVRHDNKVLQGLGLAKSYLGNRINRKNLASQYERFIFQPLSSNFEYTDPDKIPSTAVTLTPENLLPALLASGSIPMVMKGIKDIPAAPKGMYRDGGIIDYHFDIEILNPGLTLYPHFNPEPKPGWFDKSLTRRVRENHYDKTVLICPSREFIANLPFGKIPDRNDFVNLDVATRIAYWKTVLAETQRTADYLERAIISGDIVKQIKPFRS
jgi:hypothetical protein